MMGVAAFRKMDMQRRGTVSPPPVLQTEEIPTVNICPKCGQEKGKQGFHFHVKACKG